LIRELPEYRELLVYASLLPKISKPNPINVGINIFIKKSNKDPLAALAGDTPSLSKKYTEKTSLIPNPLNVIGTELSRSTIDIRGKPSSGETDLNPFRIKRNCNIYTRTKTRDIRNILRVDTL
jgi:hypothetical protein